MCGIFADLKRVHGCLQQAFEGRYFGNYGRQPTWIVGGRAERGGA